MATVEEVIERLKSEKKHLEENYIDDVRDIDLMIKAGGEKAKKRLLKRYHGHLEVVNYALNFLEGEEEEPCPD